MVSAGVSECVRVQCRRAALFHLGRAGGWCVAESGGAGLGGDPRDGGQLSNSGERRCGEQVCVAGHYGPSSGYVVVSVWHGDCGDAAGGGDVWLGFGEFGREREWRRDGACSARGGVGPCVCASSVAEY